MTPRVRIFLSYAREDRDKVKAIYRQLQSAGFEPWMDVEDLLPGEDWASCIQKVIRDSDFFLACLSANSVSKRGFLQKENKEALDIWSEKLDHDIYLIPVRLDDCEVPARLGRFQWVDWFEAAGPTKLVKAIQEGMKRRGVIIEPAGRPESGGPMELGEGISRRAEDEPTEDSAGQVPKQSAKPGPEPAMEGGCSGRIGTKMVGIQMWYRELPSDAKVAVITGIVALLVAVCGLGGTLGAPIVQSAAALLFSQPTATPSVQVYNEFTYPVEVRAKDTGKAISYIKVIVQVAGKAPVDAITDVNGLARVFIPSSLAGQPGVILVEVPGYTPYRQNIDLTQDALPDTVLLEPLPVPTPADTPTPTSTPAGTPTPTRTPEPPTATPTPTPEPPTLTPTPTPTPDCQAVQVSPCLELFLDPGQWKMICPVDDEMHLPRSQIEGLTNLQVRAILTGADAKRCLYSWKGRTDGGAWSTKTGSAGDYNFALKDLPPQVQTIDVQITVGDGQKPTSFAVKVDGQ